MAAADDRFVYPTQACAVADQTTLSADQVTQWQQQGYALVHGIFPQSLIDTFQEAAAAGASLRGRRPGLPMAHR